MNKIVCLGDSLTYGYGISDGRSWIDILSGDLKEYLFFNQGVCGDTTWDMKQRLVRDVLSYTPDALILLGGVNDILCHCAIDSIIDNIESILMGCRAKNIVSLLLLPVLISLNPGPAGWVNQRECRNIYNNIQELRIKLKEYAVKNNFPYLDLLAVYSSKENQDDFFLPDGIHIIGEIHQRIANLIERQGLKKLFGN